MAKEEDTQKFKRGVAVALCVNFHRWDVDTLDVPIGSGIWGPRHKTEVRPDKCPICGLVFTVLEAKP